VAELSTRGRGLKQQFASRLAPRINARVGRLRPWRNATPSPARSPTPTRISRATRPTSSTNPVAFDAIRPPDLGRAGRVTRSGPGVSPRSPIRSVRRSSCSRRPPAPTSCRWCRWWRKAGDRRRARSRRPSPWLLGYAGAGIFAPAAIRRLEGRPAERIAAGNFETPRSSTTGLRRAGPARADVRAHATGGLREPRPEPGASSSPTRRTSCGRRSFSLGGFLELNGRFRTWTRGDSRGVPRARMREQVARLDEACEPDPARPPLSPRRRGG